MPKEIRAMDTGNFFGIVYHSIMFAVEYLRLMDDN